MRITVGGRGENQSMLICDLNSWDKRPYPDQSVTAVQGQISKIVTGEPLTDAKIFGTHGAVDLKTVDTSALSGNLATIERFKSFDANGDGVPADKVVAGDEDYGTITGNITFQVK